MRWPPASTARIFWCGVFTLTTQLNAAIDFNREIRPILAENCFYCHGQDPNHRKGDLRLDVPDAASKPAESGELAIVPGAPEKSTLIAHIFSTEKDEQMPPPQSNRRLSAEQKDTLKQWIAEGAKYAAHWAFIPPSKSEPAPVKDESWVRNAVDRFVLAKLESRGMKPSPEADRRTLIRRLSLDLTGLPPKPEEVEAFTNDTAPDAYEQLVERLLNSAHFGERMALPWLDAARYADSNGFQQDGDTFQWIWRDWVVKALNADMPFDRFSIEQLAGDLLPNPTDEQLIATGFNRNHLVNGEGGAIPEEQRFNILFDRVDTTATNWLGLTMACAQCHDHKYDPITQRDYYGLMHSFNHLSESGLAGGGPGPMRISPPFVEFPTEENKAWLAAKTAALNTAMEQGQVKSKYDLALAAWMSAVEAETRTPDRKPLQTNLIRILRTEEGKRTKDDKRDLENGLKGAFEAKVWPAIAASDPVTKRASELKTEIATYKRETVPRVMVMRDDRPRETFILSRGDYLQPKEKTGFSTPGFLPPIPKEFPTNRLGFARWLFLPEHPLTARVQINRIWQHFFGIGFVKTAEDFGVQGETPVHQELLDYLSVEFRERGWSQKHIHRLIVNSATYRQSSKVSKELHQSDPENRLLARASRFRLPSLILRDVALSASGLLNPTLGGRPVYPYQPDAIWETLAITKERDFTYPASAGADLYRRSLYTFWRRTIGPANMFDASNRQTCKVRVATTSTPLHALTTLNDPTWTEAARMLANKTLSAAPEFEPRLEFAFQRVLSRPPSALENRILARGLEKQRAIYNGHPDAAKKLLSVGATPPSDTFPPAEQAAWTAICLGILNFDESLTRE